MRCLQRDAVTGWILPLIVMLASCSHGGSSTVIANPNAETLPRQLGARELTSAMQNTESILTGSITSVESSKKFIFDTGNPRGHLGVTYTESDVTPGGSTLRVGQVVVVTGSFESDGGFTASRVAIRLSLGGRVTSVESPTRFTYYTGFPRGHVGVTYTESQVSPSGSAVKIGDNVNVVGTFDSSGALTATKVTIDSSSSTSPYHIATWAYDDSIGQGEGVAASDVAKLVSYAQGNSKALSDCHGTSNRCLAVFYSDPGHEHSNSSGCISQPDASIVAASSESWYLHDLGYTSSSHRIYGKDSNGCKIWAMNPNASGLKSWFLSYLRDSADNYDLYLLDNDPMDIPDATYFYTSGGGCSPWPTICKSIEEAADNVELEAGRIAFSKAMSHKDGSPMHFFFQQASFNASLDIGALVGSNFVGFTCEGCISTYGSPIRPTLYARVLDEMAAVNSTPGSFLLISHGNSPAGSATQILQRLITTAVVWLAYSPGHTIVQPDLEANTNRLAVWPEDLIYPTEPVQSMKTGVKDLEVGSNEGVWRREFKMCYQKGTPFGRCAAIVNSTRANVVVSATWLSQNYRHLIALSGGDELSGGVANVDGHAFVPGVTAVPPGGALLLAQ